MHTTQFQQVDNEVLEREVVLHDAVAELSERIHELESLLAQHRPTQPANTLLTDEEVRLLVLLAQTTSMTELARAGGYCSKTVHRWIEKLCKKCGVENHHQLLVWAAQHGYLSTETFQDAKPSLSTL